MGALINLLFKKVRKIVDILKGVDDFVTVAFVSADCSVLEPLKDHKRRTLHNNNNSNNTKCKKSSCLLIYIRSVQ